MSSDLEPRLRVRGLSVAYGHVQAVDGIDLEVEPGGVVALLGANGAGKTSTVRAIMGSVRAHAEALTLGSVDLAPMSVAGRVRAGVALVPEGRRMIGPLSVEENLLLGGHTNRDRRRLREDLEAIYSRFPILYERRRTLSGALSGGEQQMLAIARALMSRASVLLMDEPTMGIAPIIVRAVQRTVREIAAQGVAVLVAEQNAAAILPLADRVVVLEVGRVVYRGTVKETMQHAALVDAFLGTADQ